MAFQIKDIFSCLYKITFDLTFYSAVFAILLGSLPNNLFKDFQYKPIQFDNEHLYKGLTNIKWNDELVTKAKIIGQNQIHGPESLVAIGEYLYTGVLGGRIIKIHKITEKIEEVIRFNKTKECQHKNDLKSGECGRFLGLRKHKNHLYALEANTGLYRIDLKKKDLFHISPNLRISDEPVIFNDLVFDPKFPELVYISVSSKKWFLDRIVWAIMEYDKSGYVLAVNMTNGQSYKLSEGHALTNGIEITADQKYLLISETSAYVIKKIDLKKAREIFQTKQTLNADKLEIFGQLLPGEVDNIRLDLNGDVLIGMFSVRHNGKRFHDYLAQWPFIRKSIGRVLYVFYLLLDYIDSNLYSNHAIQQLKDDLYTGHFLYKILPQRDGAVIRLDSKTGLIKQILGSSKFFGISEAIIDENGDLYYGSFRNKFIGHIPSIDPKILSI